MKSKVNHLALALLFGIFAYFTVVLNPEGLNVIDKVVLFAFGVLSGIQLHMLWSTHHPKEGSMKKAPPVEARRGA